MFPCFSRARRKYFAPKAQIGYNMSMKALETTGWVRDVRDIELDKPLPVAKSSRVRVIVLMPEGDEITEADWLRLTSTNSSFDFLNDPREDIYSPTDGKPFVDTV